MSDSGMRSKLAQEKPPAMSEAQLQAAIVDLARRLGYAVFHPYDSRRSSAGWPDLALARPGRFLVCELKTEKGAISRAQAEWLLVLSLAGVETHEWRPAQWLSGEIEAVLRRETSAPHSSVVKAKA